MILPTWEQLDKNQEDPEKIEEAIDRKIDDHLDDPDAHVETGQSLQSHKAAVIIDHVAHSVVRDKINYDRYTVDEHFASLDAWGKTGNCYNSGGGLWLETNATLNFVSEIKLTPHEGIDDFDHLALGAFTETLLKVGSTTYQNIYFGILTVGISGVGFKVVNGTLYAHYVDTGDNEQNAEITGVTITNWHRYKIDASTDGNVRLYIDEILKAIIPKASIKITEPYFTYYVKVTGNYIRTLYAMSLHYDENFQS